MKGEDPKRVYADIIDLPYRKKKRLQGTDRLSIYAAPTPGILPVIQKKL